jgi:outer membrane lipopolysaccharide assembly protein LptE/RlpB
MKRAMLIVFLLAGLQACGFHLRTEPTLPTNLSPIEIRGLGKNSALYRYLEHQLIASGVQIGFVEDYCPEPDAIDLDGLQALPETVSCVAARGVDGETMMPSKSNSNAILIFSNLTSRNNLMLIDERGYGVEYLIIERVDIEVTDAQGNTLMGKRTVSVDQYRYARGASLFAPAPKQEMLQDLAAEIVRTVHYGVNLSAP